MTGKDLEFETRDKPAERGITINNILLTIITLGGGTFATMITSSMTSIQDSMENMQIAIQSIKITDSVTRNEIKHIHNALDECKEWHVLTDNRMHEVEKFLGKY